MAFKPRKLLVSFLPEKDLNLTIFVPCFQIYPPPPPPPTPQRDLSLLVSTSICVLGSVLLFLVLVVFLNLHINQTRRRSAAALAFGDTNRRQDEDELEEGDFSDDHQVMRTPTVGLHRSAIDSIPVVGFKKGEGIIDSTECSVCLNEFEEDESLRLLPKCSHAFHVNCIDTWLLSHKNCPLCRDPILLTELRHQETKTNHLSSGSVEQESSGSIIPSTLPRVQSALVKYCNSGSVETMRRSFSIGGSSSLRIWRK